MPHNAGFTLNSSYLRPRSRGTVRLASAIPAAAPLIDPNYRPDPHDRALSIEGLQADPARSSPGAAEAVHPRRAAARPRRQDRCRFFDSSASTPRPRTTPRAPAAWASTARPCSTSGCGSTASSGFASPTRAAAGRARASGGRAPGARRGAGRRSPRAAARGGRSPARRRSGRRGPARGPSTRAGRPRARSSATSRPWSCCAARPRRPRGASARRAARRSVGAQPRRRERAEQLHPGPALAHEHVAQQRDELGGETSRAARGCRRSSAARSGRTPVSKPPFVFVVCAIES